MKKAGGSRHDLTDIVFSWSIDDILDESLFANLVEKIPKTFDSLNHYLGSFIYPLLEETRAELSSKLENISTLPFAEVDELKCISPVENSYLVKIDYRRNRSSDSGVKEPYRTLPGDVLILADAKPETASYLQASGRTWTFALVSQIPEDDDMNSSSTLLKVEVSEHLEWKALLEKSVFAIFLVNITTNRRIWNSLQAPQNCDILERVLCTKSVEEEDCSVCSLQSDISLYQNLDSSFCDLNESQSKAVLKCLHTAQCRHSSAIRLIWGPPGTGKTKTLATLLFYFLKMKHRVLVCAPTNVAIVQVASRVLKLVREHNKGVAPFCPLGELLLFGNKERLKMDSDVEEIYLDCRVKMLAECIAPRTGWRFAITSMIDILEDGLSQYQVFIENELIKKREAKNDKEADSSASMSFLEFFRRRYVSNAKLLERCLSIMCTQFSKIFILESNIESIVSVLALLDSFEILLMGNNIDSANFEEAFAHKEENKGSASSSDPLSMLSFKRPECVSSLVFLRDSLCKLSFPSAMSADSLVESCYEMAMLIFCTASSSFKLNSIFIKPMELVVIDEAAQLKESESVIPLQLPGVKHAILVGDEMQLSAVVESRVSDRAGFGRSLFERLSDLEHSKHLLNVQYRMHPSIGLFPNFKFYGNKIVDAPSTRSKRYLPGLMFGPYSFIDVPDGREEGGEDGYSKRNLVEVAVVLKIVKKLYCAWREQAEKFTIGIISPYAAQVAAIQQKLPGKYQSSDGFKVKVKTVDGFQGGEEDIIIVSTVRSNVSGSIGFLSNYKRMNVSITRARHCLWILGDSNTLTKSKSAWEELVHDAKNRSCFFNAGDNEELAEAILDVKKAYDQLEDLLSGNSMLFRNARWKVYFSEDFRKSFCNLSTMRVKMSIMDLLVRLSNGWRPKQKNVDIICESTSLTVKKFKVEGLYVLCTVDIKKEERYVQVLKIWEVLPLEDIGKMVKRLDAIYKTYTHDYISRCNKKCLQGDLQIPYTWDTSFDIVRHRSLCDVQTGTNSSECTSDSNLYVENTKVSESLLLMKFYSLSSDTASYLLSDHDGRGVDLPFEITDEEKEIIMFPRSTFVLGRSGTGKTTVLTMKLFGKEQLHDRAVGELLEIDPASSETSTTVEITSQANNHVLRQLFLTVSPKLSFAVKQHILKLKSFINHGKFTSESSPLKVDDVPHHEDIPDTLFDISPRSYPLVITFHKFLMMLDASVGISYFERFADLRELCHGKAQNSSSVSFQIWIRAKEVNFDKFCVDYWPHFNDKFTRKLDPSRVFTEIMSSIKGGRRVCELGNGRLSRLDYVSLSRGRVSTLTEDNREKVYDVFLDYEKMKTERGEFDLADLVIDLHFRLHQENFAGDMMDFVYVDEVQDLTMSQIALLKYICRNVEDGFVFCGDTAQTIARGVDFRFEDIRELFYNEFLLKASGSSDCTSNKGKLSKVFQLSQNFRTHSGILKMAQSVIDILYYFFPLFVDALSPETSFICGEAPIILEAGNNENAIISIFDHGNTGGDFVGFGAEQVIIVRDDCARNEVLHYVKRKALVLTIVESKGLEFQDVLLYNFFASSPLKNHWRILYAFMKEQELCDGTVPSPSFDAAKHNILCSELKQLYVAITRTRQRLWISDNEDFAKPMIDYWKQLCLVHVRHIDDSLAELMQRTSSPEEWKAQGFQLLHVGNYEMATMCFVRAGYTQGEKLAKASGLRAEAERLSYSNLEVACGYRRQAAEIFESIGKAEAAAECFYILEEYRKAGMLFESIGKVEAAAECFYKVEEYSKAGALFESIGKAESAAECYYFMKDYERAGKIYLEKCGKFALEKAGDCFNLAGRYDLAAEVYARGNNFSKCLYICAERELFELGLRFIKEWSNYSTEDTQHVKHQELQKIKQDFLERCASHYYRCKDTKSMMVYVKEFQSLNAMRDFLKRFGCLDELLLLEEEMDHYLEAANIAELKGDILLQADLLCKQGHFKEAAMRILWYVLYYSLWAPGSKGWPLKEFEKKEELIAKAMSLSVLVPHPFYEYVCIEASILSSKGSCLAELNSHLTASRRNESLGGEMLSIRQILDAHLQCNIPEIMFVDDLVLDPVKHSEKWISKNQFSLESLFHFWTLWRDLIIQIIKSLEFVEEEKMDFRDCWKFCFNYLGVLKQNHDSQDIYLLLNREASWVRNLSGKFCQRNGNSFYLEVCDYVTAARRYWCTELISVGMKALDRLDALYKFSIGNHWSAFVKIRLIIHIYEVAKFLLDFPFLSLSPQEKRTLVRYIEISTEDYFAFIFPPDWRISSTESVISLRRKEISHHLLKERFEFVTSGKKSFGSLGRLAVTILGSSTLDYVSHQKIVRFFHPNSLWKALFDSFHNNLTTEHLHPASVQGEVQVEFSLIWSLHRALQDAYNANWRIEHDYISPVCFMYLLERILISCCCLKPYFYVPRSSFVECLVMNIGNAIHCTSSEGIPLELDTVLDYVAYVVRQFLVNKQDTIDWITKSKIDAKQYYPLLVLKLVLTVCILCVNFNKCSDLLFELLSGHPISNWLPCDFICTLRKGKRNNMLNMSLVTLSQAFRKVGDPLVIVGPQGKNLNLSCPDAIFVDTSLNQAKEEILKYLFPNIIDTCKQQIQCLAIEAENSDIYSPHFDFDAAEDLNGKMNIVMGLWRGLDALQMFCSVKDVSKLGSAAPLIKSYLEKCLFSVKSSLIEYVDSTEVNVLEEPSNEDTWRQALGGLFDDFELLSKQLATRESNLEDNMSSIREISERLQARKSSIELALNKMLLGQESSSMKEKPKQGSCNSKAKKKKGKKR